MCEAHVTWLFSAARGDYLLQEGPGLAEKRPFFGLRNSPKTARPYEIRSMALPELLVANWLFKSWFYQGPQFVLLGNRHALT